MVRHESPQRCPDAALAEASNRRSAYRSTWERLIRGRARRGRDACATVFLRSSDAARTPQRPGRDHRRPLHQRGHPVARVVAILRGRRVRHAEPGWAGAAAGIGSPRRAWFRQRMTHFGGTALPQVDWRREMPPCPSFGIVPPIRSLTRLPMAGSRDRRHWRRDDDRAPLFNSAAPPAPRAQVLACAISDRWGMMPTSGRTSSPGQSISARPVWTWAGRHGRCAPWRMRRQKPFAGIGSASMPAQQMTQRRREAQQAEAQARRTALLSGGLSGLYG